MKLFMIPNDKQTETANGIGQVILAQHRYLPEYGFEFVDDFYEADLTIAHIHGQMLPSLDVLHLHGCYWTGDEPGYQPWHSEVNKNILESVKRAYAFSVPSDWVSTCFKRDMRLSPEIIGHGITLEDWTSLPVNDRKNYLLWNKNRSDLVSSPQAAIELAKRGIPVISTFGDLEVMQVTGAVPHVTMKAYLQNAGVYLSTASETFGIGILEALACGVPVLGYAHGGILDLVGHKINGYLVSPGDVDGLEIGYKYLLEHREEMQPAILKSVQGRDWKSIMGQYAQLYEQVYAEKQRQRKVSVVITNYNYGEFVNGAIESVLRQTHPVEIIVVDDGSGDDSISKLRDYEKSGRIRLITQSNSGVANARNTGISSTIGDYCICLDADDTLEPTYVETLYSAMEADRSLGVTYTGLKIQFEDGNSSVSAWPPQFDFELMAKPGAPPPNCIPCAAMFRRDMWTRAGGYKQEYAPGEDVEFWLRGLSVGFNAKRISDEPLFNYRAHANSASRTKKYTDITWDKPWAINRSLMPMAAPTSTANLVRSYSGPLVSVIIPVGPGHVKYLPKALDSLVAQTFKNWEVIVVWDASSEESTGDGPVFGKLKPLFEVYPFATVAMGLGGEGAGVSRNRGIEFANAPLLFFLDADDYLVPTALEKMVRAYEKSGGGKYIYSDWYASVPGQPLEPTECQDYSQEAVRKKIQNAVSVLVETDQVRKVGGFNEELKTLEDWDFFLRLAKTGVCGQRVAEPLLIYRTETGTRRQISFQQNDDTYAQIVRTWEGVKFMACCGGNAQVANQVKIALSYPRPSEAAPEGSTKLHYIGIHTGAASFFGYSAAQDGVNDIIFARNDDVDKLIQTGYFEVIS